MGGTLTEFEAKVIALAESTKSNNGHWAQQLRKIVEQHKPKPEIPSPFFPLAVNWQPVYKLRSGWYRKGES